MTNLLSKSTLEDPAVMGDSQFDAAAFIADWQKRGFHPIAYRIESERIRDCDWHLQYVGEDLPRSEWNGLTDEQESAIVSHLVAEGWFYNLTWDGEQKGTALVAYLARRKPSMSADCAD
ncbi:MAG TPA: hypothetical protein VM659_01465 [Dongiaceae bacterium]|nr:hypothetical protein [Dongiaceae bacterium]